MTDPRFRSRPLVRPSLSPSEFARAVDALVSTTRAELERTQALHQALLAARQ